MYAFYKAIRLVQSLLRCLTEIGIPTRPNFCAFWQMKTQQACIWLKSEEGLWTLPFFWLSDSIVPLNFRANLPGIKSWIGIKGETIFQVFLECLNSFRKARMKLIDKILRNASCFCIASCHLHELKSITESLFLTFCDLSQDITNKKNLTSLPVTLGKDSTIALTKHPTLKQKNFSITQKSWAMTAAKEKDLSTS